MDYLTNFIIEAGKVSITTEDGRKWLMRQPTPTEFFNAESAGRMQANQVKEDPWLSEFGDNSASTNKEAAIRHSAGELLYILPLILEDQNEQPVYDVYDPVAKDVYMKEITPYIPIFAEAYWGVIRGAIDLAKKKSISGISVPSNTVDTTVRGRFPILRRLPQWLKWPSTTRP